MGGGILALSGCSRLISNAAEQRIAACLPAYVGPADHWQVSVEGRPEDVLRGRFRRIVVLGRGARVRGYLRCAEMELDMPDVDLDMARRRINTMGTARFRVVLDEQDLLRYLQQDETSGTLRHMAGVGLHAGRVRVTGSYRWLRMSHPFDVTAVPELRGRRVDYSPERMYIHGVRLPIPAQVLRAVAHRLGYGFDLGSLPFPVVMERLEISNGRATATGAVQVKDFLNGAMASRGALPMSNPVVHLSN